MSRPTGFHVRHDLQPQLTRELLTLLYASDVTQTEEKLREAASRRAYRLRERKSYKKLLHSLVELRILTHYRDAIQLSDLGQKISKISSFYPHLLPEFIHFLYYTAWDEDNNYRFSWSYRVVCDWLWESSPCTIDRDRLVNVVTQRASQEFDITGISFSTSSISGILNWVAELRPTCIQKNDRQISFSPRYHCPVEIFVLSLDHVYKHRRTPDTLYLRLSPEVRREVCRMSLIRLENFDEMLDKTEVCFASLHIRKERGARFAMHDFSWNCLEV